MKVIAKRRGLARLKERKLRKRRDSRRLLMDAVEPGPASPGREERKQVTVLFAAAMSLVTMIRKIPVRARTWSGLLPGSNS